MVITVKVLSIYFVSKAFSPHNNLIISRTNTQLGLWVNFAIANYNLNDKAYPNAGRYYGIVNAA